MLLVWFYGVMVVGAVSRSAFQISTEFDRAPLAYSLSAVAGLVYAFITYTLVRGGERARRAALFCCAAELAGVLLVGTWTLVDRSAFPDATVWSYYGAGYVFIPVLLPLSAVYWLRKARDQRSS
ncbi:membrane protein [Streptomyces sp. NRRL B-3648]|nr:membrane protein [Streptomyces sp. NRRL B-3648]